MKRAFDFILTVGALVFCMLAGAAGYHQIEVANVRNEHILLNYTVKDESIYVPDEVALICVKYGEEYGIKPELLEAIAWRESRFKKSATNGPCVGIMQINTNVHKDRIKELGIEDAYDTDANVHIAADLIADLLAENPSIEYMLARYHGESRPEKVLNGAEPSNYVTKVMEVSKYLESEDLLI